MPKYKKDEADLPLELKQAADEMVARRMRNTGESQAEAAQHIADYLNERI